MVDLLRHQNKILLGLLFLVSLGVLVYGFNGFPAVDDYVYYEIIGDSGGFEYVRHLYVTWTGRVFSSAMIAVGRTFVGLEDSYILTGLLSGLLLLSAWLMSRLVNPEAARSTHFARTLLIVCIFWFAFEPNTLAVMFFWVTGGFVYAAPLVLGLIWCLSFRSACSSDRGEQPSNMRIALAFFISVLAGNAFESLSPALVTFGILYAWRYWRFQTPRHHLDWILRIVGLIVGTAANALAPGNFMRAGAKTGNYSTNLAQLASNLAEVTGNYLDWWQQGFGLTVLAGLVLLGLGPISHERDRGRQQEFVFQAGALFMTALATLPPMALVPAWSPPRTALFFNTFVTLAILSAFEAIARMPSIRRFRRPSVSLAALAVVAGAALCFLWSWRSELLLLRGYSRELSQHLEQLRRIPNPAWEKIVAIPPIRAAKPKRIEAGPLSVDPQAWKNKAVAYYYKLNSVKVDPKLPQGAIVVLGSARPPYENMSLPASQRREDSSIFNARQKRKQQ